MTPRDFEPLPPAPWTADPATGDVIDAEGGLVAHVDPAAPGAAAALRLILAAPELALRARDLYEHVRWTRLGDPDDRLLAALREALQAARPDRPLRGGDGAEAIRPSGLPEAGAPCRRGIPIRTVPAAGPRPELPAPRCAPDDETAPDGWLPPEAVLIRTDGRRSRPSTEPDPGRAAVDDRRVSGGTGSADRPAAPASSRPNPS